MFCGNTPNRAPPRQSCVPGSACPLRAGFLLALLTAALGATVGCGPPRDRTPDGRLAVAVSILPQVWLVQQIGGEHVDVVPIVRPGASPATYQPSDAEVSRVMRSAIYFRIGVPFERGAWFRAIEASERLEIVDTRGGIPLRNIEAHDHHEVAHPDGGHDDGEHARHNEHAQHDEHGTGETCDHDHACGHADGKDPHIWLNPRLLKRQAAVVADALVRADPQHRDAYQSNLAALNERLDAVDREIRDKLAPYQGRAFFVFHPAWGYFADEYSLEQIAIEVEGKEPSDNELTRVQEQAREVNANVIFVQPEISSRAAEAVASAIGGRIERLDPLAEDVAAGLVAAADAIANSLQ